MTFRVAIIGRPNVGKSTLFNRLTGTKHALVADTPGVTRDRREGEANLADLRFIIFDTAGLEEADEGSLAARMTQQTMRGLAEADMALMLVDGRAGITPMDEHFASLVRKSGTPVALIVNKAEGNAADSTLLDAYRLGLGDPVGFSAAHGEGLSDLYDALAAHMPDNSAFETDHAGRLKMAIIGRPNAGKSTLVNRLLGHDRVLTGPEAGITRDAIAIPFEWEGRPITLVDTAGLRKRANVEPGLEKMATGDALRAIRYAEVIILMMDATLALEKQDLQLADLAEREGRAVILAVNKWDLVPPAKQKAYLKDAQSRMDEALTQLKGVPIIPLSAEKGHGLEALMAAALSVHETWNKRVPTAALNRWLEEALDRHAPPMVSKRRLKFRYVTQVKARPPTFSFSTNMTDIPEHYVRYLSNSLRECFDLQGVPLRLKLRKPKNPYAKDPS